MTTSSTPTPDADPGSGVHPDRLLEDALHRVWGFSSFRPLQREAMQAILQSRDSVVVLPTGGGKSLCFQAPAIVELEPRIADLGVRNADSESAIPNPQSTIQSATRSPQSAMDTRRGVALVVSPLISLM